MFGGCGKGGAGDKEAGHPHSVAVDGSGTVYLSEFENHRVSVFGPTCLHLMSFWQEGGVAWGA